MAARLDRIGVSSAVTCEPWCGVGNSERMEPTPSGFIFAAQALRHGLTLVTAAVAEFARVPGLNWEHWAAP